MAKSAGSIGGIDIAFGADLSRALAAFAEFGRVLSKTVSTTTKQVDQLVRTIGVLDATGSLVAETVAKLNRVSTRGGLAATTRATADAMNNLSAATARASAQADVAAASSARLTTQLAATARAGQALVQNSAGAQGFRDLAAIAPRAAATTRSVSSAITTAVQNGQRQFGNFSTSLANSLTAARNQVSAFSVAIGALGTVGTFFTGARFVAAAGQFDRAMTAVRAVTKVTSDEFEATRKRVIRLADAMNVSATGVATALNEVVQAGFETEDAFAIVEAGIQGAFAGMTSTETATSGLIQVLNAFKIPASQSAEVMGKLVKAVDIGVFTFEKLTANIGQVAPLAKVAGLSLEELLGTLSSATRSESNLDEVTTQMRALLSDIIAPADNAEQQMEKVLGTTVEVALATQGFTQTLRELIASTNGSATALAVMFPNIRAVNLASKLLTDNLQGADRDMKILASTGAPALTETVRIQEKAFSFLVREIQAVLANTLVKFFEDNRQAFVGMATAIRDGLKFLSNYSREIGVVLAALGSLIVTSGALRLALFALNPVIGVTAAGLRTLGAVTSGQVAASLTSLATGAKGAVASLTSLLGISRLTIAAQDAMVIATNRNAVAMLGFTDAVEAKAKTSNELRGAIASQFAGIGAAATKAKASVTGLGATLKGVFTGAAVGSSIASVKAGVAAIGLSLKGFAASIAAALAPVAILAASIAAMVVTAKAFYELGRRIAVLFGAQTREDEKRAKALQEQEKINNQIAQAYAEQVRQQTNLSAADRLEQRTARMREFVALLEEVAAGNTEAAVEARRLNAEIEALGGQDAIEVLEFKVQSLKDELSRGGVDVSSNTFSNVTSKNIVALAQAFAQVRGIGADAALAVAQDFLDTQRAIDNAASATEDFTDALAGALKLSREKSLALVTNSLERVKTLAEEARALGEERTKAGRTSEQRSRDELEAELDRLRVIEEALQTRLEFAEKVRDEIAGSSVEQSEQVNRDIAAIVASFKDIDAARAASLAAIEALDQKARETRAKEERDIVDDIFDYEIDALKKRGKIKQAEEAVAKKAYDEALRRAAKIAETNTALAEKYRQAAERAYDAEREQIEENERQRIQSSEAVRRATAEAEAEKQRNLRETQAELLRQRIEQAKLLGDIRGELRLRELLRDLVRDSGDLKSQELLKDKELVAAAQERLELLREEIKTRLRIGGKPGESADLARRAQRDIIGTSDVIDFRGTARERFREADSTEAVNDIVKLVTDALKLEYRDLQNALRDAVSRGDSGAAEDAAQALREVGEKVRILREESRRAAKELSIDAKGTRFTNQAPTPGTPGAPGVIPPEQQQGPPQPGLSDKPPVVPPTAAPAAPTDAVGGKVESATAALGAVESAVKAASDAAVRLSDAVVKSGMAATAAVQAVSKKLGETIAVVNEHTGLFRAVEAQAQSLRLEAR